jgi:hypothetical protein
MNLAFGIDGFQILGRLLAAPQEKQICFYSFRSIPSGRSNVMFVLSIPAKIGLVLGLQVIVRGRLRPRDPDAILLRRHPRLAEVRQFSRQILKIHAGQNFHAK